MNTEALHRRQPGVPLMPLLAFALLWSGSLSAQVPVDEDGNAIEAEVLDDFAEQGAVTTPLPEEDAPPLTQEELDALVGPIALYPDKLLAIVLPASTYPLEIVQAARFLEQLEEDSSLKPDESWDDSVTALLNYPEVVKMMNDDIDWTWRLGEAVVRQQADVVAAVELFRDRAYAAGNLKSDERQTISNNGGAIAIEPVEEDVIYVPYYEPERVVHYQPRQVYYYYPRPYPVYYYPYPAYHSFRSGYFWGVTTAFHIGWATDHLHVFHHSYWGHPYYGRQYFGHYYRRPSITVYNRYYANSHRHRSDDHHRVGDYWQPRDGGARPGHYRARLERFGDNPRTRTAAGYRVPPRDATGVTRNRTGFRGETGNTVRNDDVREGFASSRDARSRDSTDRARRAARTSDAANNDAIRFRPRERAATTSVPARSGRDAAAARVVERSGTPRLDERRNSNDAVRFRAREGSAGTIARPETAGIPSGSRNAAPGRLTERSRSNERTVAVRERTRAAVPAARPAPSNSGFRSAPAPRTSISRPQASPRSAPGASAPAPRPRASAPPRTPTPTTRSAPPRESRAAPARSSGSSSSRTSRTREH